MIKFSDLKKDLIKIIEQKSSLFPQEDKLILMDGFVPYLLEEVYLEEESEDPFYNWHEREPFIKKGLTVACVGNKTGLVYYFDLGSIIKGFENLPKNYLMNL